MGWVALLHEQAKVQAGWTPTDTDDFHDPLLICFGLVYFNIEITFLESTFSVKQKEKQSKETKG